MSGQGFYPNSAINNGPRLDSFVVRASIDSASVDLPSKSDALNRRVVTASVNECRNRYGTLLREAIYCLPDDFSCEVITCDEDTGRLELQVPGKHIEGVKRMLRDKIALNGKGIWSVNDMQEKPRAHIAA